MPTSMDRGARRRSQNVLADTATDIITEVNRLVQAWTDANTAMATGTIRVISDLVAGVSDSVVRGVSDVGDTLDRRRRRERSDDREDGPGRTPVTRLARTLSRAVNEQARVLQEASERFATVYESRAGRAADRRLDEADEGETADRGYDDMTVDELRQLARERDLASEMNRAELIRALRESDRDRDSRPGGQRSYEDITVEDLRELAREREISGRSEMNRAELIRALRESDRDRDSRPGGQRSYEDMTVEDLRELAREREISGRSEMKKTELVRELHAWDREHTGR